ncbi:MAG TPA: TraB/GumN family protein, partial [Dongiaceae bacterium]|nr:TraB/GumN family protein [Dongiaceae bacterium]
LQRLKPWAVGLMLNLPTQSLEPVLDVSLQYRFQDAGKPVQSLETIDEQLDLFDRMTLPEQVEFLQASLEQIPEFDSNLAQMKQLYRAGDIDAIHDFAKNQTHKVKSPVMERLMAQIVEQRNKRMVERLRGYLQSSGNLIAVGALHLPGQDGILQLLRNAGYRVQPVTP